MSVPDPLVEMYMGGSWVDVSSGVAPNRWLDTAAAPLTIVRGRDNEQSDTAAGTCTFSLINDDGRFTLANTSGAYSPNFKLWIQVRVTINGVREFTGYMSNAETMWDDDTGLHAHTAVTCTDLLGMMAMSAPMESWSDTLIGALSPLYWWKFDDLEGSTTAAATAGGIPLEATIWANGTGDTKTVPDLIQFGTEGPKSLEAGTQATYSPNSDGGAAYLAMSGGTLAALPAQTTGFTILMLHTPPKPGTYDGVGSKPLWEIRNVGGGSPYFQAIRFGLDLYVNTYTTAFAQAQYTNFFARGVPSLIAVTVSTTTVTILGTGQSFARPDSTYTWAGTALRVGYPSNTYNLLAGDVAQLAIVPGVMSESDYVGMRAKILGDGSAPVLDWLNRAISEAGYGSSATATYNRTMERPNLKGSNPATVGSELADSAGSVFAADKSGNPEWYDFTYAPTRIDIAAGEWESTSNWAPDQSLYYSEIQFNGVVAASVPGAFPRKALDVQPLLPAAEQANYATWLKWASDIITGPRLSQIRIDMATCATPATYQAIDLKSRIALAAVPAQIPANSVMTVEGYTVTVSATSWDMNLSTAPDPRFVVGDTVAAVVGAQRYRICPF